MKTLEVETTGGGGKNEEEKEEKEKYERMRRTKRMWKTFRQQQRLRDRTMRKIRGGRRKGKDCKRKKKTQSQYLLMNL